MSIVDFFPLTIRFKYTFSFNVYTKTKQNSCFIRYLKQNLTTLWVNSHQQNIKSTITEFNMFLLVLICEMSNKSIKHYLRRKVYLKINLENNHLKVT